MGLSDMAMLPLWSLLGNEIWKLYIVSEKKLKILVKMLLVMLQLSFLLFSQY